MGTLESSAAFCTVVFVFGYLAFVVVVVFAAVSVVPLIVIRAGLIVSGTLIRSGFRWPVTRGQETP